MAQLLHKKTRLYQRHVHEDTSSLAKGPPPPNVQCVCVCTTETRLLVPAILLWLSTSFVKLCRMTAGGTDRHTCIYTMYMNTISPRDKEVQSNYTQEQLFFLVTASGGTQTHHIEHTMLSFFPPSLPLSTPPLPPH